MDEQNQSGTEQPAPKFEFIESVMIRKDRTAEAEMRQKIADTLDFSNLPILPSNE